MTTARPEITSVLKNRFGFDRFLPLQEEIVSNVLAGNDSLVLMPTGGGKSLCYQLPALCQDGYTMVVSPLIALMKDQVDGLQANGIPAAFVNSTLTPQENEGVLTSAAQGEVKILYVAPERLATPRFRNFMESAGPSLIAIDEAHCISEWGHDFRPDYRNLKNVRDLLPGVPVIALTATATERVRGDIASQLRIESGKSFVSSFNRPNLSYTVKPKLRSFGSLVELVDRHKDESAIIYCFSRKETEALAADLVSVGISAAPYHAGLDNPVRRATQDKFIKDEISVIVATIAFGMGIDKPDVRLVVHYNLPKTVEAYYQETGRAGRDGLPSECVLFYTFGDKVKQDFFINQIEDLDERNHAAEKLAKMVDYCELRSCRRQFMLNYFGEEWVPESGGDDCGGCDVCLAVKEEFDATEIAQKILSAIIRTGERFGIKYVADVLRGSNAKRIRELQHDQLTVHGIASESSDSELREMFGLLQDEGLVAVSLGEYHTVSVTAAGRALLTERTTLKLARMPQSAEVPSSREPRDGSRSKNLEYDRELFALLRGLRKQIAQERNVPAFVIFGDVSLREMAYYFPNDHDLFGTITGVGTAKLDQFADRFISLISEYCEEHDLSPRPKVGGRLRKPGKKRARSALSRSLTETKRLFAEGFSVDEIASERGFGAQTILSHLEKIGRADADFNLEPLLPSPERITAIESVLRSNENGYLAPIKEELGDDYSYEEIRIVRLQMEREIEGPE